MTPFILFSMPRTGSTMLRTRLSQHPKVKCFGEIFGPPFNPEKRKGVSGRLPQWADIEKRCANIETFLADIYRVGRRFDAVGFKHHLSEDRRVTEYALAKEGMRRFHIIRPNHLATYSSNKLVQEGQKPNVFAASVVAPAKTLFDAEEFARHIESRTRLQDDWKRALDDADVIEVSYLEACDGSGVEKVWRALGFEPAAASEAPTQKKNSSLLLDRFLNPDDVADWLAANGRMDWAQEN